MPNLARVVRLLKKEQDRLAKELRGIGAALAAFGKAYVKGTGSRKLSASARARIAASQRARGQNSGRRPRSFPSGESGRYRQLREERSLRHKERDGQR
jgi:hypothetical protein